MDSHPLRHRRLVVAGAVAAGALGLVESLIGAVDESRGLLGLTAGRAVAHPTETVTRRRSWRGEEVARLLQRRADVARHLHGAAIAGVGQDDGKLFAAEAGDEVAGPGDDVLRGLRRSA